MTVGPVGLVELDGILTARYEADARGRLVGVRGGGFPPRFVLARCAEGCTWRFGAGLPERIVAEVAKLAGREPGLEPERAGVDGARPPERLAVIARALCGELDARRFERLPIERAGRVHAELWTLT